MSNGYNSGAAVGCFSNGSGSGAAVGYLSNGQKYSLALGNGAKAYHYVDGSYEYDIWNRTEIAPCDNNGAYNSRISGHRTGDVCFSFKQTDEAFTYLSSPGFGNPDGSLPAGMYGARVNSSGSQLVFYVSTPSGLRYGAIALSIYP
jgi:hypothetical protein